MEKRLQEHQKSSRPFADSRRIFLRDGKLFREGEILRQPDLAATLAPPPEEWAARVLRRRNRPAHRGRHAGASRTDHAGRSPRIRGERARAAARKLSRLRDYFDAASLRRGAVLIEMLNILEGFDLKKLQPFSSEYYHLLVETMRRAYADRAEYHGRRRFRAGPDRGNDRQGLRGAAAEHDQTDRASPSSEIGAGKPPGTSRPRPRISRLSMRRETRSRTPTR